MPGDEPDPLCPEADQLRRDADKKLKSFNIFGSAAKRQLEAADLYARAANKYRVAKLWDEAGETHILAAKNFELASNDDWVDARKNYEEGAKCLARCKPEEAIEAYKSAALLCLKENSFSMAAHNYKALGELCEEEELGLDVAIDAFRRAADCYEAADAVRNQLDMLLKVALFSAKAEQYEQAIENYSKVIDSSTKGSARSAGESAAFSCVLCHLAWKESSCEKAESMFDEYKDRFDGWGKSVNGKLLEDIFDAIHHADVAKWEKAVLQADSRSALSAFHKSLLSQAQQNKLESAAELDLT